MTSTWIKRTIDDICVFRGGGTPSKSKESYWKGDIPWVSPKDMKSDVITDSIDHISAAAIKESTTNLIPAGSILVVVRSGILARTIPVAITGRDLTINQDIKALCPDSTVDSWFLFYFLKSRLEEMLGLASRGATVHRIMADQIRLMAIPVPPLPEQQRIVGILDEAFEGIATAKANAEKNVHNARALFESHLQSVFAERGAGWSEKSLGDAELLAIIDGDRGKNYPKAADFHDSGDCLFLNTKNVRPDGFDFESTMFISADKDQMLRKGKLNRDDVVLTTRGTIGNIGLYSDDVPFDDIRINSGMLILRSNKRVLLPEYLFELLRSDIVKDQIRRQTTGAAQPQLPIKTLVNFTVPVPEQIDDQRSLVTKLRAFEPETQRLTTIYERKLAALDDLKKSLLHQAFSGEL